MDIQPLSPNVGAVVTGVDVKQLTDSEFDALYKAWLSACVLVIRGQELDDDALKAFSERFGPLEPRPTGEATQDIEQHRMNQYVTVISNIVVNGKLQYRGIQICAK